jgi:uncharacterized membrane protein YciS (DUF1049 family)
MLIDLINTVLFKFWIRLVDFLPQFFTGIIVFLIGIITANLITKFLYLFVKFLKIDNFSKKIKRITQIEFDVWSSSVIEIVKWIVVIAFIIPTLEIWGLPKAVNLLNQLISYLPNVIVSVIIAFFGLLSANLFASLISHSFPKGKTRNSLVLLSKSIILFFTILIILNQLGVAQDLIRILFAGLVAMLAIAGGLAFGLGGKDIAGEILNEIKKNLVK